MLLFYLSLIEDSSQHDKFEEIYHRYRWLMFSTAKEILKSKELAEEATQEAFIKIAKIVNTIEDAYSYKTKNYVVLITRNVCLDVLDKEKRHMGLLNLDDNEISDTVEYFDLQTLEMQSIVEVIETLADEDRDIIQLRYFYNYSEKEIAQMLDFKYDAMRKRLQRAKNKLGKLLKEKGE